MCWLICCVNSKNDIEMLLISLPDPHIKSKPQHTGHGNRVFQRRMSSAGSLLKTGLEGLGLLGI